MVHEYITYPVMMKGSNGAGSYLIVKTERVSYIFAWRHIWVIKRYGALKFFESQESLDSEVLKAYGHRINKLLDSMSNIVFDLKKR